MRCSALAASVLFLFALANPTAVGARPRPTPTPPGGPPAPVLVAPASGAALVQPIGLDWDAVVAPGGDIGSYTWQVGTTSAFATIIASGFTNIDSDPTVPTRTADKVSGLPNGTYFWRVKATQLTINGGVDSPWSAVRTFTVTGLGAAPATPAFITPANNAQFHLIESYKIQWTTVASAQYYVLEADDEPTFSYPFTLTQSPITFGTQFGGDWGNALTVYYRIRAVSVDGVRSLPSATLTVKITDAAPAPPAVSQVAPAAGATVSTPFFFDWSDAPNPQVPGYDVDVNTSPTFPDISSVLFLSPTRSDYMITADLLAPGSYFWRVRALAGNGVGPWSPGRAVTVTAGPIPPDVGLFAILAEPVNGYGGNSVQARVMLDNPAPTGGAVVTLATDLPQVQLPVTTVTIPAGKTDATITPIATGPVPNYGLSIGIIGDLFAGFGGGRGQNSLGILPILFGTGLSTEYVVGGTAITGTVTLLSAAPPGGITVRLVSSDTSVVQPPATVLIPAGATGADVSISTSAVSVPTRVTIDTGTEIEGFRAPQGSIVVTPPGSPAPAASLSSLTLGQSSVLAGGTITGTVSLTSPAPAGGAVVTLSASMEGQVIAPASVTVPAGSLRASFTTTPAPETVVPRWVLVQAHYGTSGGTQARVLEIDPAPGVPTLLAIGPAGQDVIGGNPGRASVALVMPAPAGGGVVSLSTDNPSVIQVPATVAIAEGNSAVSFTITTSPVTGLPTGGNIFATAGGVTKSIFVNVVPDPNAPPLLQSVSITPTSVPGGTNATGTVFFSAPAPAGGTSVTLSTSNSGAATVPGIVVVPAGQKSANFTVTTFAVTADTSVTISAFLDAIRTATVLVTKNTVPPGSLSSITLNPSSVTGGNTSQATVTLSSAAPSGGAVVTLSSSNTAVATVPASVTIVAGMTSGTATVTSKTVTTSATATITATYNSVSRSAILTVNPSGGGTLPAPLLLAPAADARFAPGTNITFDWTDVSGAATYTIQIDDSDTFSVPLIVEQNVTTSQFSSSTLPTKTMWFRARANDASGNPGSWSAIRRFEVKN
jgi:hypothetical protein